MKNNNILQIFYSRNLLLIFAMALFSISCNDSVLQEKPLDFLTPSNAYTTKAGASQGISGLYTYARDKMISAEQSMAILYGLGSDVTFHGENPSAGWGLTDYKRDLTSTNGNITWYWKNGYIIIQRTNVLIDGIKNSELKNWKDEQERKAYLAEAMFFRANEYRILVYLFGDVPLITEVVASPKTDFIRAPKAEVYKQIEQDLTFACANLPLPGKEEATGRINQGAAWHLLSEVYLAEGKFQLAADAAGKVISGYNYSLMTKRFGTKLGNDVFGSGDVFYDLFQKDNQNLKENTENIWALQFEPNLINGGGQYNGPRFFGPCYWQMGNAPDGKKAIVGKMYNGVLTGYQDTLNRPVGWSKPTNYLAYDIWRSDWNKDIRNAKHNIKRDFYFDNSASIYNKKKIDFNLYKLAGVTSRDNIRDTCQYIFPYFIKCTTPLEYFADFARMGGGGVHKDIYAMRLAETYLFRAEAYLGLGKKDLAADDINVVRRRANATPITTAQVTLNYILDERARELYAEEMRTLTLLRLGLLVERVRTYNNNPINAKNNIQDYNNLWPIPQTEIDLNLGAKLVQNPGY